MTWSQNYTPLADSIGLSALVAALPVVTFLALLAFWHVRAHLAALAGLLVAAARTCSIVATQLEPNSHPLISLTEIRIRYNPFPYQFAMHRTGWFALAGIVGASVLIAGGGGRAVVLSALLVALACLFWGFDNHFQHRHGHEA